jgi:hypothetical protein
MTNISIESNRELTDAELESVVAGTPTVKSVIAGAESGAKQGSAFGQSHFGDVGGVVGGAVGAVVGAVAALFE